MEMITNISTIVVGFYREEIIADSNAHCGVPFQTDLNVIKTVIFHSCK